MNNNSKINLLNFDRQGLQQYFVQLGEKPFRGDQVVKWIHQEGVTDFQAMTNLSKSLRDRLQVEAEIKLPEVAMEKIAQDGCYKWLLRLDDGNCIETVFIPEKTRGTLCISSQVGCALDCSFCATGKQGFSRNLTVAEIIGQLWFAKFRLAQGQPKNHRMITNVVMMGMGEPLLNFDNVVKSMDLMMDDLAHGLSKYRVTLSTSGVIPAMQELRKVSKVALAVSLHAPTDQLRNILVPLNKKYPLQQLMSVCKEYFNGEPKREITFEYVMLEDVNDTLDHAQQLANLMRGIPGKINLIPFNPFPYTQYKCSKVTVISQFQEYLMSKGLNVRVRKTRAPDIDGACGQLRGNFADRTTRNTRWLKKVIPIQVIAAS